MGCYSFCLAQAPPWPCAACAGWYDTLYVLTKHLQGGLHNPWEPCGSLKAASQHLAGGVCTIRGEITGGAGRYTTDLEVILTHLSHILTSTSSHITTCMLAKEKSCSSHQDETFQPRSQVFGDGSQVRSKFNHNMCRHSTTHTPSHP